MIDKMREHFRELAEGKLTPRQAETHFMEIMLMMKEGLGDLAMTLESNYTVDSLKTKIKFADKKVYSIEIKEVK